MPTPKLARLLLGILALEVGICTIFLADEWAPLRKFEKKVFSAFLRTTRGHNAYVVEDTNPSARERLVRPLTKGQTLRYLRVEVNQDLDSTLDADGTPTESQVFESYPFSPTDWATIITNTHKAGCRTLAIDTPLTWENKDELDLLAVNYAISAFERSVLTVDLNLRAKAASSLKPPRYLARHAIPLTQVQGKTNNIHEVNQVPLPPSAIGSENTIFSFRFHANAEQEADQTNEENVLLPAFVLWGDLLIPSFPLAVAMARYQAGPEDIQIIMGKHIRVGEGPLLPIDDFGNLELLLPPEVDGRSIMLPADRVANAEHLGEEFTFDETSMALLAESTPSSPRPWGNPARLQKIINTIDTLPQPGVTVAHPRLPVWGELLFLSAIALSAAMLLRLPHLSRTAAFSLLLFASVGLLAVLLKTTLTWIPLLPVVITTLVGLLLTFHLSKYAPAPTVMLPSNEPEHDHLP